MGALETAHARVGAIVPRGGIALAWPIALGIACARIGLATTTSAYRGTDQGVLTDGAALISLVVLAALASALAAAHASTLDRETHGALRWVSLVQGVLILALAAVCFAGSCTFSVHFMFNIAISALSMLAISLWLCFARRLSASTMTAALFAGLAISDVFLLAVSFTPECVYLLLCALASCAQPLLARKWRDREGAIAAASSIFDVSAISDSFFLFAKDGRAKGRFAMAGAIGIGLLAMVNGFLRGFPNGDPVALDAVARIACFVLSELVYLTFFVAACRRSERSMTVGIWVALELLAGAALVLYTGFPQDPGFGAAVVTALNSLLLAAVCYVIVAFMAAGNRDPLLFATVIWVVLLAFRAFGRFVLIALVPFGHDSHFAGSVVSFILLVSAQIVFVQIIDIVRFSAKRTVRVSAAHGVEGAQPVFDFGAVPLASDSGASAPDPALDLDHERPSVLDKILGIDDESTLTDIRAASMRHNADEIGRQFLLSNREVEVLSLYALGYTQKRLAEELGVSQGTVRTHIKRIYAKTGLHSRQEILDYLERYAS